MTARPTPRPSRAFTLIELLVVIAIIGVLIALLLPAVQACRSAARRMNCVSNMMQAAIALENYESSFESLPPGVVNASSPISNTKSGYHMGWMVQVLPFLDQKPAFNHTNFAMGVYAPENTSVRSVLIASYLCPADPEARTPSAEGLARSSFVGCHHSVEAPIADTNDGVLYLNSRVRTEDIEDGASQTLLFGEAKTESGTLGWASGTRATLRNTGTGVNGLPPLVSKANTDPVGGFSSYHAGGSNFAFCDGSVRFLKNTTNSNILGKLANRKDGQLLSDGSF